VLKDADSDETPKNKKEQTHLQAHNNFSMLQKRQSENIKSISINTLKNNNLRQSRQQESLEKHSPAEQLKDLQFTFSKNKPPHN